MTKQCWKLCRRAHFIHNEIEKLRTLLKKLERPLGISSLAHSSEFPVSIGLNVSDEMFVNSLILDSGATDHMTHSL